MLCTPRIFSDSSRTHWDPVYSTMPDLTNPVQVRAEGFTFIFCYATRLEVFLVVETKKLSDLFRKPTQFSSFGARPVTLVS